MVASTARAVLLGSSTLDRRRLPLVIASLSHQPRPSFELPKVLTVGARRRARSRWSGWRCATKTISSSNLVAIGSDLAFALFVLMIAGLEPRRLVRGAAVVSAADLAWVAATVVVITTVDLRNAGLVALGIVATIVAGFGGTQLIFRSRAANVPNPDTPVLEQVRVQHHVDAPVSAVWPLLTDHDLYGRLAPNLSRVEVVHGDGDGMQRRCYNTGGRGWNETCTLWDDGHEFAVEVDTADYPYPLAAMRGSGPSKQTRTARGSRCRSSSRRAPNWLAASSPRSCCSPSGRCCGESLAAGNDNSRRMLS